MSEEKIKVSEFAKEFTKEFPAVPQKDMLRVMRELGTSAKTLAGSLSTEEAARVREHFAEQKQADAERSGSHPNVIVRRRRKDADKADAPEAAEAASAVTEVSAPEAVEKPAEAESPVVAEAAPAPKAEAPAASPRKAQEKAEPVAAKAETAGTPKATKARVVSAARVISRPGEEEKKPEPVVAEKKPRAPKFHPWPLRLPPVPLMKPK